MPTNYPTSLDSLTNPTSSDPQNNPSHSGQHANANDAIEAIETFLGTSSAPLPTILDTDGTLAANSDTKIASQKAVKTYSDLGKSTAEGSLLNGKISISVDSNNITLALKTLAGADATSSTPIYCVIGGVIRSVTAALSVTKNAGTNWFNAGSAELATKEIDYFAYLGYNATNGVTIGFARIPYACQYSDFSTTTTNENYCAISTITNATSTDYYNVIGRFAATLSAGAGYTWSVPTFTAVNLIQRPILETRWLAYIPTVTSSIGTITTIGAVSGSYQVIGKTINVFHLITITTNGTGSDSVRGTIPFSASVATFQIFSGRENAVTGNMLQCRNANNYLEYYTYNNGYPGGNGYAINGGASGMRLV